MLATTCVRFRLHFPFNPQRILQPNLNYDQMNERPRLTRRLPPIAHPIVANRALGSTFKIFCSTILIVLQNSVRYGSIGLHGWDYHRKLDVVDIASTERCSSRDNPDQLFPVGRTLVRSGRSGR